MNPSISIVHSDENVWMGESGSFVVVRCGACWSWAVLGVVWVEVISALSLAASSGTEFFVAFEVDRTCNVWVGVFIFVGSTGLVG